MRFFYGKIDDSIYGFKISDEDLSADGNYIELTRDAYSELLEQNSKGKYIVFYDGSVFATEEKHKYYVDGSGNWKKRSNKQIKEIEEKEQRDRFDSLFLTAADVERAIYKAKGMDFEDLIELTKDNPDIDTKALKIELKANNFFRGNPYINQIGEILGFSQTQLDKFFETNNYEELINADLV